MPDETPTNAPEPSRYTAMPGHTGYREVTIAAIVFAIIIGVVMNAAITYAGLKIGFTIGGSAIAAVLGFGVLRGILRRGSILETNIAQTVASTVNTSNSGVIFTVPVLFLLGYTLTPRESDFWLIMLACIGGAFLGTAFIIPLRKQMLDIERLRFPSPTGVALILKSPGAGTAKSLVLVAGIVLGALVFLPAGLPGLTRTAALDDFAALVDAGEITPEAAARGRLLSAWMEAERAPDAVIAAGTAAERLADIQKQIRDAQSAEDTPTADALKASLAGIEAQALETMSALEADPALAGVTSDMAREVSLAAESGDWSALRSSAAGWPMQALAGYRSLDWRMPVERDAQRMNEVLDAATLRLPPIQLAERLLEHEDLDHAIVRRHLGAEWRQLAEPDLRERVEASLDALFLSRRVSRDDDGRPDRILSDTTVDVGRFFGLPDEFQLIFAIAPFALGAGYITGRAGLFVLAGGILAFFVLNPIAFRMDWLPVHLEAHQAPGYAFNAFNRPLGIGLLLGGALMGVLASVPAIREAVKSIGAAAKLRTGSDELGLKTLAVAVVGGFIFLFLAADFMGNKPVNRFCPVVDEARIVSSVETADYGGYTIGFSSPEAAQTWDTWTDETRSTWLRESNIRPGWLAGLPPHVRAALIALVGAIWIWFAGVIIAQCAGMTDWSPISGMSLLTVVLIMMMAGTGAVVGSVLIGAALCVAVTLASDMMGDLKTGYIVGSLPKRQQIAELCVVWIGPIICLATLMIIVNANLSQGLPPIGPGTQTVAPQAQALEVVIQGVQGGQMPYALYGFGALLGGLLGLGAFSGLGVLVGLSMFLPFMYIATYGIGCIANMMIVKVKGRAWAEEWGVPFCAGLIVGESLLALTINFIVLFR